MLEGEGSTYRPSFLVDRFTIRKNESRLSSLDIGHYQ